MTKRSHSDDLRGAGKLAVEATKRVTALVEAMHNEIASGPAVLGKPLSGPVRVWTRIMYGSVQATAHLVGAAIDGALAQLAPLLGESVPGDEREVLRAVLNGVLGDYLEESGNPLAIQMALRMAVPSRRMIVMVHGSSMSDRQWLAREHDHGAKLAEALGWGVAYLHYNSGLHISENGRRFATVLAQLDVDDVILVTHSMGGLVARSALAETQHKVRALVCLGTPHHGAPLERGGNWIHALIGVSRYSAPIAQLARIRSAGVTDLRYGNVRHSDWEGRDRFARGSDPRTPLPLPAGVACFALAGTRSLEVEPGLKSDGLVPVDSALGRHDDTDKCLAFRGEAIVYGVNHIELIHDQRVYAQLLAWLQDKI